MENKVVGSDPMDDEVLELIHISKYCYDDGFLSQCAYLVLVVKKSSLKNVETIFNENIICNVADNLDWCLLYLLCRNIALCLAAMFKKITMIFSTTL